ncbi:MICOS complex subunit MIC10 isoform X1 [Ochotona curzoniae]|uniref:MICOS complex subunit MIC10 isoform X1 n=1 Tax=Ochotona curzoniae TaxID=130825 RepID=UPI001B34A108|nr:MICOS complex subunit MIC10 isoform X1 [Ochotona curzoniae]
MEPRVGNMSESDVGRKWDRCMADTVVKLGTGFGLGVVFSLTFFKSEKIVAFGLWLRHGPGHGLLQLSARLPVTVPAAREIRQRAGAAVTHAENVTV